MIMVSPLALAPERLSMSFLQNRTPYLFAFQPVKPLLSKPNESGFDLRAGGLGDVWMRLVGFYAMAALRAETIFNLAVPQALETIALRAFGDRLRISY
jgi:hypothetical protein